jgi:hypothetical protein
MTAAEFIKRVQSGKCPFCGEALKFYEGCLGYEAMRCVPCGFHSTGTGVHEIMCEIEVTKGGGDGTSETE